MKLKKIILMILAACLIIGLVACGGDDASDSDANADKTEEKTSAPAEEDDTEEVTEEEVVLSIAWWGSQKRHDDTVKVIEMYEDKNPHVKIEFEFYDFDGYFNKLDTLVASGQVWDMFQMGGNFPIYESIILPLNDLVDRGIIDTSNTTEAFLETTSSDGNLWGLSNGVNTYGIAYDPALFAEAGVEEPTENWTWDDYYNACMKIHEELGIYGSSEFNDFIAGVSTGISQEDYTLNFFAPSNDKLGFDDYTMLVDYIEMRADLTNAGAYPDPGAISEIKDIEGDYIVTGDAAMVWVPTNQFITLSEAAGRELKLATVPRKDPNGPSGMAIQSSQMFCISKESEHPEEAAKFLNYFWTDEEANLVLGGERGNTIFSNVREAQEELMTPEQIAIGEYIDMVGNFKTGEVNVISPPEQPEIEDYYNLTMDRVIYGDMTAEEAAKDFFEFSKSQFE